jgi:hypothetical protein
MVGVRALGLMCNDPQRGQLALHEAGGLVQMSEGADALGVASIVDGAALLSRLPALPAGAGLPDAVGPIKGRCAVVQVRVRSELRPHGPDGHANLGPWRARSYAAAVVGGPQDADAASASREKLLAGLPDFLRRFIGGQSEGEAFFVAVLARLHARGLLDSPHQNGTALAEVTKELVEKHGGPARHVVITNGLELVQVSSGMPSAILTLQGLTEDVASRVDPAASCCSAPST